MMTPVSSRSHPLEFEEVFFATPDQKFKNYQEYLDFLPYISAIASSVDFWANIFEQNGIDADPANLSRDFFRDARLENPAIREILDEIIF